MKFLNILSSAFSIVECSLSYTGTSLQPPHSIKDLVVEFCDRFHKYCLKSSYQPLAL
jgi:hypothetical protein